jgi:hypothetical protein
MERFQSLPCLAGILQPGDRTRYVMAVVERWDCYEVAVLNDCWVDKLIFLKVDQSYYKSERGELTNPWTIKAAKEMVERYLGTWKEATKDGKAT